MRLFATSEEEKEKEPARKVPFKKKIKLLLTPLMRMQNGTRSMLKSLTRMKMMVVSLRMDVAVAVVSPVAAAPARVTVRAAVRATVRATSNKNMVHLLLLLRIFISIISRVAALKDQCRFEGKTY